MKNHRPQISLLQNRGSVLGWVLVVSVVFSLLFLYLMPTMLSYMQRGLYEYKQKQAELTARSTTKAIFSALVNDVPDLVTAVKSISAVGGQVAIDQVTYQNNQMGTVVAKIKKLSDTSYVIVSKATVGDISATSSMRLTRKDVPVFGPQGFEGIFVKNVTISQGGFSVKEGTDLIISGTMQMSGQSSLTVGKNLIVLPGSNLSFSGNSKVTVANSIYTQNGTFTVGGNSTVYIQGKAYTKSNSPLTANVATNNVHYCPYVKTLTQAMIDSGTAIPNWVRYTGTPLPTTGLLQRNQYYTLTGSSTINNLQSRLATDVSGIFPVFIILKDGSSLTVTQPIDPPVNGKINTPRVYFILEGTSTLTIPANSCIVAYGGPNSKINVSSSGTISQPLYGQISIGTLYNLNSSNQVSLEYVNTNVAGNAGSDIFIPGASQWKVDKYTEDQY